jgi:hypothetical protein
VLIQVGGIQFAWRFGQGRHGRIGEGLQFIALIDTYCPRRFADRNFPVEYRYMLYYLLQILPAVHCIIDDDGVSKMHLPPNGDLPTNFVQKEERKPQ